MARLVGFFIDPDITHRFGGPSPKTPTHCPPLDRMNLIPTQLQLRCYRCFAGLLEPLDGQSLKQRRETAAWFGPWQFHHSRPVFVAIGSGRTRMQDRPILAGG